MPLPQSSSPLFYHICLGTCAAHGYIKRLNSMITGTGVLDLVPLPFAFIAVWIHGADQTLGGLKLPVMEQVDSDLRMIHAMQCWAE